MSLVENVARVTLADRLDHGYVTVREICDLKLCGTTTVYADIKAGVLKVEKHGRSTRISGHVAKAYVPGSRHLNMEPA